MNDRSWITPLTTLYGRWHEWTQPDQRFESMPRPLWRRCALVCFVVGAAIGAVLGRRDPVLAIAAAILLGLIAVPVGMYVVESRWLRRRAARPPAS